MGTVHEKYLDSDAVAGPSNRGFGITMCIVLLLATNIGIFKYDLSLTVVTVNASIALLLAFLACLAPNSLHYLNKLWGKFGALLHSIMTPAIMLLIYIVAFVPMGLLLKLCGKNSMLQYKTASDSYWINKEPVELQNPLKYQF